jgi:hypothetical protein
MSESGHTFELRFEGLSSKDAGILAQSLRDELNQVPGRPVDASLKKGDPRTQDFGATLVVALGAAVAGSFAEGLAKGAAKGLVEAIASFLQRKHATISISVVVASGISGSDAARIADAFAGRKE